MPTYGPHLMDRPSAPPAECAARVWTTQMAGCHPGVTPELEKWSGRLDSNQRTPWAKEPTQLGAAGDRCPSFSLGHSQLGATAVNREPLPIVSQLSANG
jgi:hypothetical protein